MKELESIAKRFDLSISELARIMGVKESEIGQWQAGEAEPSKGKLCKLFGFISRHHLMQDSSSEEFMLGRDDVQPQWEESQVLNALKLELSQADNEKVLSKLNQATSTANLLLLATDENELHHGAVSLLSDILFDMKQLLKT
ncbi:helix-turn-helix transcriptional regulator [uncultured Shewanella sp.]|uniref:helix-turn-helix domain-containing protein n=1 Tax=uncultured Shewanella sp. TaxID=173975 RepID=UPI00262EFD03|nr:helix-turn-helix transcriptional regulator [uncultured Shewanella sp.]